MKISPLTSALVVPTGPRSAAGSSGDIFTPGEPLDPATALRSLRLHAPSQPHVAWQADLPSGRRTPCAVGQDGTVYSLGSDNTLRAFDPFNGRPLWSLERIGEPRQESYLEPGPRRLYAAGSEGTILALDPADGKPLWAQSLVGPLESAPCQAPDGTLLVAGRGGLLYALDPASGERAWVARVSRSGYLTERPVTDGKTVYAGTAEGRLLALDLATGEKQWELSLGPVCVRPSLTRRGLAVGTSDGRVLGFSGPKQLWQFQGDAKDRFLAPLEVGETTVAACGTYAVGLRDGAEVWRLERPLGASPTLDGQGRLVLASSDGRVDVLDPASGHPAWKVSVALAPDGAPVAGPGGTLLHTGGGRLTALVEDDAAWTTARSEQTETCASVVEGEQTITLGGIRLKRRGNNLG